MLKLADVEKRKFEIENKKILQEGEEILENIFYCHKMTTFTVMLPPKPIMWISICNICTVTDDTVVDLVKTN